jgi:hypothetical protein
VSSNIPPLKFASYYYDQLFSFVKSLKIFPKIKKAPCYKESLGDAGLGAGVGGWEVVVER